MRLALDFALFGGLADCLVLGTSTMFHFFILISFGKGDQESFVKLSAVFALYGK